MKTQEYLQNILKLGFSENQKKYYNFLLNKGILFKEIEQRKRVERLSRFNNPQIKQCYRNSLILALSTEVEYVEGYYVFDNLGFPIEHAWNTQGDKVIDTTAILLDNQPDEYFGIIVPKDVLRKYLDTEQFFTALQFYYNEYGNNF